MRVARVFVDTGAWFAVQATDDRHHKTARAIFAQLLAAGTALIVSNAVIGETYTLLRVSRGYREAKRFLDIVAQSRQIERRFVTEALERKAYEILEGFADHPFSFVDATSFALMREECIQHAFAFDAHFATAGFLPIPQDVRLIT